MKECRRGCLRYGCCGLARGKLGMRRSEEEAPRRKSTGEDARGACEKGLTGGDNFHSLPARVGEQAVARACCL